LTRALRRRGPHRHAHAESRGLELALVWPSPATLDDRGWRAGRADAVEHGAFTALDTAATAHALMWLALGLPAQVLVKALSPHFSP